MSERPYSVPRGTNPFWREGPEAGGLRNAVPIRPFIRTAEDRRSAERAAELLERHLVLDLGALRERAVPEEMLERIEDMYRAQLAVVEVQLLEYARLQAGQLPGEMPLADLRAGLVRLRIARGFTQRELARALGVADSTVSRDEKSLYAGLTVKKAIRILEALNARATVSIQVP